MHRTRKGTLRSLLIGLAAAILFTLAAMLILAAALVYLPIGDHTLRVCNQIIKLVAVVIGCCAAIPRGGEKGLATGLTLALFYIALGYGCYLALGGGFEAVCMLGEMLLGGATGALTGAVRANLHPRRRSAG